MLEASGTVTERPRGLGRGRALPVTFLAGELPRAALLVVDGKSEKEGALAEEVDLSLVCGFARANPSCGPMELRPVLPLRELSDSVRVLPGRDVTCFSPTRVLFGRIKDTADGFGVPSSAWLNMMLYRSI